MIANFCMKDESNGINGWRLQAKIKFINIKTKAENIVFFDEKCQSKIYYFLDGIYIIDSVIATIEPQGNTRYRKHDGSLNGGDISWLHLDLKNEFIIKNNGKYYLGNWIQVADCQMEFVLKNHCGIKYNSLKVGNEKTDFDTKILKNSLELIDFSKSLIGIYPWLDFIDNTHKVF